MSADRLGKRYRLNLDTIGVCLVDGRNTVIQIPEGTIVQLTSPLSSNNGKMIDVLWNDKSVSVFAQDVLDRGEDVDSSVT